MGGGDAAAIYGRGDWEIDLARRELRAAGAPIPIGGRAFDILEILVASAGDLVSKDEMLSRVWPDTVVEENTLQVHISAVRKALGADRGLLKTTSGRGYRLLGDWTVRPRGSGHDVAALAPPPRQQERVYLGNLPMGGTALIGRAEAMRQLRDLTSAYRMVTLTGHGGIGKSKLALETARDRLPEFQGDVWLVELASIADPNLVSSAVAGALGMELGRDRISPLSVARGSGARRLLLVLDNCEHVIDAAAELAETVLRMCPAVALLATSREHLRIDGEGIYPVPPLEVPAREDDGREAMLATSAVRLFIERTAALRSDFAPSGEELRVIAAICRRLDGIPLAIELAAARAASLGLEPVLARLGERFDLLTGGRRTALPRHKTLRATLDWSYELLPESERRLLRFLSIFAVGFTLEAAAAVMGDGSSALLVAEGVANLVAKSLISFDGTGATDRWRLLETTRAYALGKLAEGGEAGATARRHAEYLRDLMVSRASGTEPQLTAEALARYGRELDNVRAALDWAFSPAGDAAIGRALTAAFVPVWFHYELMVECRERAERALDGIDADAPRTAPLRMQLHLALGIGLTFTLGPIESTKTALAKALQLAEQLDDDHVQLRSLWGLMSLNWDIGENRAAQAGADAFSRVARRTGDPALALVGDRLVGVTRQTGGQQREARRYLQRVMDSYVTPAEDRRHTVWFHFDQAALARAMLARVLALEGLVEQAQEHARIALQTAQAAAHVSSQLYALVFAHYPISLTVGDLPAAEQAVAMVLDLAARHNATFWRNLGRCLEGKLLVKRGEFEAGARVLRGALATYEETGWTMSRPEFAGALAEAMGALGEIGDALVVIDRALGWADAGGERWYYPELLRLKGELLLRQPGAAPAAEACFARALDIGHEQGALFWELRAAVSLARLRVQQGRAAEGRLLLAPVFGRFTEGFDAPDLRAARALLESLPPA